MRTDPLFSISDSAGRGMVTITFDGQNVTVPEGISVAAALLVAGADSFRTSAVGEAPRAPYCMMGVCFECLVEIDGQQARQSCLIPVARGMQVRRQHGAPALDELLHGGDE